MPLRAQQQEQARPTARMPAAMLVWPAIRRAPIARLRRVAITRGALPTRTTHKSDSTWRSARSCWHSEEACWRVLTYAPR